MTLMKEVCTDYGQLLGQFVNGSLSVEEFQAIYLEKFKQEKRHMTDAVYELLEGVFGDIDSFTFDPELHAESPQFYLDECALREKIRNACNLLQNIQD